MSREMIEGLIAKEKSHIKYFFDRLDVSSAIHFLEALQNCKGLLIFTGVGKSELVAKKIAMTMTSTGTPALFLSPMNALHGDIGIVSSKDVFVMLSKSGESDELLQLIPSLRSKGVLILGMVSEPNSRLAKACDLFVTVPVEEELCPFGLAPTTSAVAQMLLGDVFSVALMTKKQFSLDEYAQNHPSGLIGRRITLRVKDLMLTGNAIPTCLPEAKLLDILVELSDKKCGCVLIVDKEFNLKGIFTDGDLRRALGKYSAAALEKRVEELMSKNPKNVLPDLLGWEALKLMESDSKHPVTVLPVVNEAKKIQGIIRMHDIIQSGLGGRPRS